MDEEVVNWDDYIHVASQSDVGMRRSNNQDNLSVSIAGSLEQWRRNGHLFVVADGMGAHAAGELASQLAADNLSHLFVRNAAEPIDVRLRKSIEQTNLEIHRRGQANPDFYNMGTTCSSLAITTDGAVVGHVGDSRVYRLRQNRLEQLTFDHSLVWELKASGQLTDDSEATVPKNVITRSLGPYAEVKVDVEGPFPVEPGDTFLLCSDGLTGVVTDDEIGPILGGLSVEEAADVLIQLANLRGGPDNITVIVVKIVERVRKGGDVGHAETESSSAPWLAVSWTLFGVMVIIAVVLGLIQGSWMAAAVPAAAALVALVLSLVITARQLGSGDNGGPKGSFGKAPYTNSTVSFSKELTTRLFHMVREILETARKDEWNLRWSEIEEKLTAIQGHKEKAEYRDAIAEYCRLISSIMQQVRRRSQ